MRITARVTSHGDRWSADFPQVERAKCFPMLDGKEVAQPDECLRQLNDESITHSSKDTDLLRSIVCLWICKINEWKDSNTIGKPGDSEHSGVDDTRKRLSRKMERGKYCYVRAEWMPVGYDQLRFRISTKDNDVIEKERWERLFAWVLVESAKTVSEELAEVGYKPIVFDEEAERMYRDLLAWRKERADAKENAKRNDNRLLCDNYRNGYCTPCKPDCPHYRNGRCEEV